MIGLFAKKGFFKSRAGMAIVAVLMLLIAYGAGSWAIDSGSVWLYGIAIGAVYFGFKNLWQAIRSQN